MKTKVLLTIAFFLFMLDTFGQNSTVKLTFTAVDITASVLTRQS
jgi:hypothetical protein